MRKEPSECPQPESPWKPHVQFPVVVREYTAAGVVVEDACGMHWIMRGGRYYACKPKTLEEALDETKALKRRLRRLLPRVEYETMEVPCPSGNDPHQNWAEYSDHIVEQALVKLVEESTERLQELCRSVIIATKAEY